MSKAQEVAALIHAEAQSGSAYWDELNGPDAVFAKISDTKFTVTLPTWRDEDEEEPTGPRVQITVEETT